MNLGWGGLGGRAGVRACVCFTPGVAGCTLLAVGFTSIEQFRLGLPAQACHVLEASFSP